MKFDTLVPYGCGSPEAVKFENPIPVECSMANGTQIGHTEIAIAPMIAQ